MMLCWRLHSAYNEGVFCECLGPVQSYLWWQLQLALWWSLFENASASVRSGDIFSGFIYLISGSNSTVGYIQGINGCMQASLVDSYTSMCPPLVWSRLALAWDTWSTFYVHLTCMHRHQTARIICSRLC